MSRSAIIRIAIIFLFVAVVVGFSWWNMIRMPLRSFQGELPSLTVEQQQISDELRRHVTKLATEIGERNVFRPDRLRDSAEYIESVFRSAGYAVRRQSYIASGETCHNLEVQISGTGRKEEIVVIGGHYDSVFGTAGANDNASGIASLLVLARVFQGRELNRTVRFVAFVNEEPPFFQTQQMGSLVYARESRKAAEKIVAMLSLETMGYFSDAKRSQRYPFPLGLFYPSRGNFIAFVGNTENVELVRQCIGVFRKQVSFPSEGAALPGTLPGINWSDHWSFSTVGYPAIMITDTALFRYPYYHSAEDLPDKLDYPGLARVTEGLIPVIAALADPR